MQGTLSPARVAMPAARTAAEAVLNVRDLSVTFATEKGPLVAVREVSFDLRAGETLALVGESGSGKSVTSLAIMRLTPSAPRVKLGGSVQFTDGKGRTRDLLTLEADAMRGIRGNEISMIFQEPMTSLNPVHRIGDQIAEAITFHEKTGTRAALERAAQLLDQVGIPDARRRLSAYPHQLSGGMRQRVMIAMALACNPRVLIADEPTTALDVTVQAQILELLKELQSATGMAVIFVTHNLGVVAEVADRVMVMYAGAIVERGDVVPVMTRPLMPYTQGLLHSVPRLDPEALGREPLEAIPGNVPDPLRQPPGCAFAPRCRHVEPACEAAMPALEEADGGRQVRCRRWRAIDEAQR
ncbi:ABC transporter ATP-binding protein [Dongia deserti]|uniref:ABC transporter ATP-binding protein n=1 Tax=Dongia deserti TaxID=2268030 RepID=UPI0025496234|nr:ABC transporter ATP-binding protein [Dongia deserti]